ncbi:MAG: 2-dehydropantoate 2-reductase [Chloroflexota bacterium]
MAVNSSARRVVIYGAGAIGSVVGGLLARGGKDVILLGRSGHVEAISQKGLRLVTPAATYSLSVTAVFSLEQIAFGEGDVVFLCVKSHDTEESLRQLRAAAPDIPVFCFQNGVRNEEVASRYFERVYGVKVSAPCVFLTYGEVTAVREPPGWFVMGRYPTGTDDLVESVAADMRSAGFYVLVTPDIMPHKWGKLIDNLGNAVGAITDARGGEANRIAGAAREEATEVLAQAGVRWVSAEALAQEWPDSAIKPRVLETRAQSSTWQSLARQQRTVESEFFNGEIVRLARQLGRRAPVNETLLRISEQMAARGELPGRYTPAELSRMAGLA